MASVTTRRMSRVVLLRWLAVGSVAAAVALLSGCVPTTETFWSPDGSAVAYQSDGQLYLYDVVTKESREVNTGDLLVGPLAWSPDGKTIACYGGGTDEKQPLSLYAVDSTSGEAILLARDVWPRFESGEEPESPEMDNSPQAAMVFVLLCGQPVAWSPDCKRIAYLAASDLRFQVVVVDIASGASKAVVESSNCIGFIAWSPDGTRLAYVTSPLESSPVSAKAALLTYEFSGDTCTKITDMPGDDNSAGTRLQWSPDSTRIGLIVPDPPNNAAMGCLVEAKPGAELRRVVRGISEAAAWSPDLKGIVFVEEREEAAVVLYRGVRPPVRRVLGSIPMGSGIVIAPCSIPQFSPDGLFVSFLNSMEEDRLTLEVLPVR